MTVIQKRLDVLLRHIANVKDNCLLLAQKLEERGEGDFAIKLIANGHTHDNSKFHGIEWEYLHGDVKDSEPELFKCAALQHVKNNQHHPEYWDSIHNMPRIYLAEHVPDILARSQEFGQCINDWIENEAMAKYKYTKKDKTGKEIRGFLQLLLEGSFK